jgi:AraC family transcriptional regulator
MARPHRYTAIRCIQERPAVILRDMPATWNPSFRPGFYARWGKENCIISARTKACEYPQFRQRLSIKAAWGGCEDYFIDGRRVAVDDDSFLILNDARTYGSRVQSRMPIHSFAIFFRPGIAADVLRTLERSNERLLEHDGAGSTTEVEFSEQLRRHDRAITPVLRFIQRHVDAGVADESWYEEQLFFLIERMIALQRRDLSAAELVPAARRATREELQRRIALGADFISTHYSERICLDDMAAAALLSPYHFLRVFKSVHGCTPATYLNRKRIEVAARLLRTSSIPVDDVATLVGFENRSTLFRQMKRLRGIGPTALRAQSTAPSAV